MIKPTTGKWGFIMTQYATFKEAWKANQKNLKLYVPVVERVHGKHHPEFHEVRQQFDLLVEQIKAAGRGKPKLDEQLEALRRISGNYTVPGDVCESYEAVYVMLAELDKAYHA